MNIYSISLFTTLLQKTNYPPPPPTKNLLHTKTNPPYIFIFPLTNISFIEYPHIGDDMIIYIHISSERSPTDKQMIFLLSQIINIYIYQCYYNTKNTHKKPPHVYPYYRINHLSLFL